MTWLVDREKEKEIWNLSLQHECISLEQKNWMSLEDRLRHILEMRFLAGYLSFISFCLPFLKKDILWLIHSHCLLFCKSCHFHHFVISLKIHQAFKIKMSPKVEYPHKMCKCRQYLLKLCFQQDLFPLCQRLHLYTLLELEIN